MEKRICKICKASWIPRTEKPVRCPRCQSKDWEKGKKKNKIISVLVIMLMLLTARSYAQVIQPADINMERIAQIESSGNPSAVNERSGCIGLYQINPKGALADWNQYHPKEQYSREDLFDPEINERIAVWYLKSRIPAMLRHYGKPVDVEHVLWSYSAGIGMVVKGIMPKETKDYIRKYLK